MEEKYEFTEQELKELCWSFWIEGLDVHSPFGSSSVSKMEEDESFQEWFESHLTNLNSVFI